MDFLDFVIFKWEERFSKIYLSLEPLSWGQTPPDQLAVCLSVFVYSGDLFVVTRAGRARLQALQMSWQIFPLRSQRWRIKINRSRLVRQQSLHLFVEFGYITVMCLIIQKLSCLCPLIVLPTLIQRGCKSQKNKLIFLSCICRVCGLVCF